MSTGALESEAREETKPRRSSGSVARRFWTGTSLALAVVLCFVVDIWLPRGVMPWAIGSLLALAASLEVARMGRLSDQGLQRPLLLALLVVALGSGGLLLSAGDSVPTWVGLATAYGVVGAICAFATGRSPAGPWLAARFGIWILPPLVSLGWVGFEHGMPALAALVVLSKIGDIFGYFVGRAIGRSHPFPRLSPGKTTAGCVASLVAGTLAGAVLAWVGWLPTEGVFWGLLSGAFLNVAAQAGDLLESAVKRAAEVKDSSHWVGAAGGVLDVVDSLLLSVPVAVLLWSI